MQKLKLTDNVMIPASEVPSFRTSLALQNENQNNLLIKTWGGIGDQICAEPTLRYVLKHFKNVKISLASELPELFTHLKFHEVFDLRKVKPNEENYLVFNTINHPQSLTWEFMSHMLTHCVDFSSLCAFRMMLPIADKEIKLPNTEVKPPRYDVVIHAGRHWQSKTFPKSFWDGVIEILVSEGFRPVLIGADADDNRGTVDVNAKDCLDLRGKLSLPKSIALLKNCKVLLTNDSAPLHMAASGDAWIGFVATVKHPDFITHWRRGQWGYKMQNFGRSGAWELYDGCPNKSETVEIENVGDNLLKWLPSPKEFAAWAIEKARNG